VKAKLPVESCPARGDVRDGDTPSLPAAVRGRSGRRCAFSLVEVLLVMALLSLIVLVLMTVFNSTQSAFRAGVTQTDVLEGGRVAMDLIVSDLKAVTPSGSYSNIAVPYPEANLFAAANGNNYQPLIQSLPGSFNGEQRTNVVENLFMVSRQNLNGRDCWVGTGYTVVATNALPLFPLYRFTTNSPVSTSSPSNLFSAFILAIQASVYTNTGWSHLIDGVVDLRVHPFDVNGYQMTNSIQVNSGVTTYYTNAYILPPQWSIPQWGESTYYFFSNTIPASVEVQMGALEDRVLQRAESLPAQSTVQSNYLSQEAAHVRVFRQHVLIPNVDPTAYP
jgi:type II secretory pathway pseudopilin PulG